MIFSVYNENLDFNKLKKNIDSLPVCLRDNIFEKFFHFKIDCDYLLNWFENNTEMDILKDRKKISNILHIILQSAISIEYLSEKNIYFKESYKCHYLEDKKYFIQLKNEDSFLLTILMFMWH